MAKDKDYIKMIHSSDWLKLRRDKLKANPLCQECLKNGRKTAATEVHHITPVEDARSYRQKELLMFSFVNLLSVCRTCHCNIHTELGSRSKKEMAAKRRKQEMDDFMKKFSQNESEEEFQKQKRGAVIFQEGWPSI